MPKYRKSKEKTETDSLLPDIFAYLERIDDNIPVTVEGLEDIIDVVIAKSKLNRDQAEIITRLFFQEIRNSILNGNKIILRKFGNIFISSPKTGNSKKIFTKFEPSPLLIKKINENI